MEVPEYSVICAFTSLQLLHQHVQMAYGDSEDFFRGQECLAVDYKGQVLENTQIFWSHQATNVDKEMVEAPFSGY